MTTSKKTLPVLPAELRLGGFTSHVCDSPSMPADVHDVFVVAFDIKAESTAAFAERDLHEDEARKAAEAESAALAGEFVRGNFGGSADELAAQIEEHRTKASRAQRRIDGLEIAKSRIVAMIHTTIAENIDEWRRGAAADAEAFLVDLTAGLAMARDAAVRGRRSLGALSALGDFEGVRDSGYEDGRVGSLRVMGRPNGWEMSIETAIAELERAVALASQELRDRMMTETERKKADAQRAAEKPSIVDPDDDVASDVESDNDFDVEVPL